MGVGSKYMPFVVGSDVVGWVSEPLGRKMHEVRLVPLSHLPLASACACEQERAFKETSARIREAGEGWRWREWGNGGRR